jgi:hypothetical protein
MLITVCSQAHFARLFLGHNFPLPLQKMADGKLFAATSFADLAHGGIYTGSSDKLMSGVSQVESYILRQNTDFVKLVSTKICWFS